MGCDKCPNRDFEPVSDVVVGRHLRGTGAKGKPFVMGVYPLSNDDTVRFAAIDFDKSSWRADVHSVVQVLRELDLPVACERSRSGNGAHLWFFFDEPVAAGYVRDVLSVEILFGVAARFKGEAYGVAEPGLFRETPLDAAGRGRDRTQRAVVAVCAKARTANGRRQRGDCEF